MTSSIRHGSFRLDRSSHCNDTIACSDINMYLLQSLLLLIVQELCESRGGRPGLSVLTSLPVSVDVKIY